MTERRRRTPDDTPGSRRPDHGLRIPAPRDTGGAWRPKHRPQDPAVDPKEPYGGEPSSTGRDHAWSGCTMSAGADALAYHSHYDGGTLAPWGGDLRHRQSDMTGGTDLADLAEAWASYGAKLTIRSGAGWPAVGDAHREGRAVVIQGTGQVPGAGDFDGGHACCIGPETRTSDGAWLFGDPLVSDWQWISPSAIHDWAARWQASIAFAVSRTPAAEPPPPPPEPDCPDCPPAEQHTPAQLEAMESRAAAAAVTAAQDAEVTTWVAWLRDPRPAPADRWQLGAWADPSDLEREIEEELPDPCEPGAPARWSRGPYPFPVTSALEALYRAPAWSSSGWTAALWH